MKSPGLGSATSASSTDTCGLDAAIDAWVIPALARRFLEVRRSEVQIVPEKTKPEDSFFALRPTNFQRNSLSGIAPAEAKTEVKTKRTTAALAEASLLRSRDMPRHQPNHPLAVCGPNQGFPSGPAWFHGRYSDAGSETDRSIHQQLRACREAARKDGFEIPDDCVFADQGVRGAVKHRAGIDHLLELLQSGVIRCSDLYIFDTARLARDTEIAMRYHKRFDFYKVRIHYVANGMVSGTAGFDLQRPIGRGA